MSRSAAIKVAGPGALLVAKAYKVRDRVAGGGRRVQGVGKDCTDLLRLLRAGDDHDLVGRIKRLLASPVSAIPTQEAMEYLGTLFMERGGSGGTLLKEAAPSPRVGAEWAASATALIEELAGRVDEQ